MIGKLGIALICPETRLVSARKDHAAVVIVRAYVMGSSALENSRESELRVFPHELAVIELRLEMNVAVSILRQMKAEVGRIRRAWRDQVGIDSCARRPGIALVYRISVRVYRQGAIEVGAGFDRTAPVIFHHTAPEQHAPAIIRCLQFQPAIESIDRPAGKEMTDSERAHHYIDANRLSRPHAGLHAVKRSRDWRCFRSSRRSGRRLHRRFFSHGKGRLQLRSG